MKTELKENNMKNFYIVNVELRSAEQMCINVNFMDCYESVEDAILLAVNYIHENFKNSKIVNLSVKQNLNL